MGRPFADCKYTNSFLNNEITDAEAKSLFCLFLLLSYVSAELVWDMFSHKWSLLGDFFFPFLFFLTHTTRYVLIFM